MNTPVAFNGALMLGAQSIVSSNINGPFVIADEDLPYESDWVGHSFESFMRIYGLIHPLTGALRYIGGTFRPLDTRVREHIRNAHRSDQTPSRPVYEWITDLREQGLSPSVVTLATISTAANVPNYGRLIEKLFVEQYNDLGFNLLNVRR